MSRYHTIDVTSGEIVAETNRHPMLAPLRAPRRRSSSRAGLNIKRRHATHVDMETALMVVAMTALGFGPIAWSYALRPFVY